MAITHSYVFDKGIFEVHNSPPLFSTKRVKQTHSDIVLVVDPLQKDIEVIGTGDGIIDREKKYHLAVLTADCIPLLFIGEKGNAMVHAGWAGVKNQISLDPKIQELLVHHIYIGPHIRLNNFEVQIDFKNHFTEEKYYHQIENRLHFDLTTKLIDDLKKTYPSAQIIDCHLDTRAEERFHSYRRNKTVLRNWNVFKVK